MQGTAFRFFATAVVFVVIGMAWGIHMSATGNHLYAPAHAHVNLLGWVTMGLFGIYYHLVPAAAASRLATIHYAVATLGVVLIAPGIVMAIDGTGEALAKAGSVLSILSMLIFLWTVISTRSKTA